jgi:class 3 adenylate cyclase
LQIAAMPNNNNTGDAYLCAAGCPEKLVDHAERIADMAVEMLEKIKDIKTPDGNPLKIRIGLHCGPAVAGIVGIKTIRYQLWGDSVQVAQQMEATGIISHCALLFAL